MSIIHRINNMYNKAVNNQNQQLGAQVNCNSSNTIDPNMQALLDQLQQQMGSSSQIGSVGQPVLLPTLTTSYYPPLSPEEEQELKDLVKERELNIKSHKLQRFRELPRDYRQTIINLLMWDEVVDDINATKGDVTQRESELQQRKDWASGQSFTQMFHPHSHSFGGFGDRIKLSATPKLPEGITIQDLVQAHIDASMEEELGSGQE